MDIGKLKKCWTIVKTLHDVTRKTNKRARFQRTSAKTSWCILPNVCAKLEIFVIKALPFGYISVFFLKKKWLQMPKREIIYIFHSLPTNHAAQNASSAGLKKVNQFWQKPLPRAIFLFLPITDTLIKESGTNIFLHECRKTRVKSLVKNLC